MLKLTPFIMPFLLKCSSFCNGILWSIVTNTLLKNRIFPVLYLDYLNDYVLLQFKGTDL